MIGRGRQSAAKRIVALLLLAVTAAGMMAAEDPGCDQAKGRTPQNAEHDPNPSAHSYLFRLQFAAHPGRTVKISYRFGGSGENNISWGQPGWSTQRTVVPGTRLWLRVRTDAGALATVTCAISWVEDAKRIRVRAHHIQRGSTGCELEYVVRVGEEDYPSK